MTMIQGRPAWWLLLLPMRWGTEPKERLVSLWVREEEAKEQMTTQLLPRWSRYVSAEEAKAEGRNS